MSYEQATHLAQTWGLALLATTFLGAVIYALWPANRDQFAEAARTPLNDDENENDDVRAN